MKLCSVRKISTAASNINKKQLPDSEDIFIGNTGSNATDSIGQYKSVGL